MLRPGGGAAALARALLGVRVALHRLAGGQPRALRAGRSNDVASHLIGVMIHLQLGCNSHLVGLCCEQDTSWFYGVLHYNDTLGTRYSTR